VIREGQVFGRYEIEDVIGEGGMGRVYRARDMVLGRRVALKVLHTDASRASARIEREARAVASLDHPNVVAVFDAGEIEGHPFLAMEHLEGKSLRAYVGDATVPFPERLRWLTAIATGLAAAHARGIVHRDVKPENVIIATDGTPKVLDFGIAIQESGAAREPDPKAIAALTTTGGIVGTPRYMAPEQMLGETVDGRADQFAWGVLAFELLAGESPWGVQDEAVQIVARVLSPTRATLAGRASVSAGIVAIVDRAIDREPARRFTSMGEVVAALARVAAGKPAIVDRRPSRARVLVAAAALAVAAASVFGGVFARRHSAQASVLTAASVAAPTSLDLLTPATAVPEALVHYRRAMKDSHDAIAGSQSELRQAVTLDPSFAAAQLRLALLTALPGARVMFQEAVRLKSALDFRDQAILDAEAPLILDVTPDVAEAERRLQDLHLARPRDIEVLGLLASIQRKTEPAAARATYEQMLALDPTMAAAELGLAGLADEDGRWEDAFEHDNRCTRISPTATACILDAAKLRARLGQCAEFADGLQRALVLDENDYFTLKSQIAALLTSAASRDEVDALVERTLASPALQAAPPSTRRSASDALRGTAALWFGSMLEAHKLADDAYEANAGAGAQGDAFFAERLVVREQLGNEAGARALARAYAVARASQVPGALDGVALRALREHDGRSADEVATLRDRWIGAPADAGGPRDWHEWVTYYATPATTRAEAEAALGRRGDFVPVPDFPSARDSGAVGHVLLLAGRGGEALRWLELAAHTCQPVVRETSNSYVPAILHAAYELGLARESTGDKAGACVAYQQVLDRWGKAVPRSTLAEAARGRRLSLACEP
jgi:tetratricopeptide (TPR) repeat protein